MDREELLKRYSKGERDFSHTDLSHTDLSHAYLSGADFSHTDLSGTDLSCANLSDADLSHSCLNGADLRCANLSDADLSGADLSGANIDNASWLILFGSKNVKVDKVIAMQLAASFIYLVCDDPEVKEAQSLILAIAKKTHIAHHILED